MKIVYVITPDPKRPDLARDAYERKEDAEQLARDLARITQKPWYVVRASLQRTEHVFSGLDTPELHAMYKRAPGK